MRGSGNDEDIEGSIFKISFSRFPLQGLGNLLMAMDGGRWAGERDPARHGATSACPSGIFEESAATLERCVQIPQRSQLETPSFVC